MSQLQDAAPIWVFALHRHGVPHCQIVASRTLGTGESAVEQDSVLVPDEVSEDRLAQAIEEILRSNHDIPPNSYTLIRARNRTYEAIVAPALQVIWTQGTRFRQHQTQDPLEFPHISQSEAARISAYWRRMPVIALANPQDSDRAINLIAHRVRNPPAPPTGNPVVILNADGSLLFAPLDPRSPPETDNGPPAAPASSGSHCNPGTQLPDVAPAVPFDYRSFHAPHNHTPPVRPNSPPVPSLSSAGFRQPPQPHPLPPFAPSSIPVPQWARPRIFPLPEPRMVRVPFLPAHQWPGFANYSMRGLWQRTPTFPRFHAFPSRLHVY
ncbi:hypothetical protein R3P38DRAFT_2852258 [Favolaschia claudopus]|uniref:Uncharacterized protein n=1 Tax=Favolaschia claudopus TaxID=2862362 RepID=A0AAW0DM56_9AGAR